MHRTALSSTLCACLALPLSAADHVVSTSGVPGTYANVNLAMQAAAPGDRILIEPGSYPSFYWSKGVSILGLGAAPADVVIARVDFQPKFPNIDYDTLLSNVTLESGNPIDAIKFTGNELPPGVLVLDGVVIKGGVYLGSGPMGLHVTLNNCLVEPEPGQGFFSTAVYLGGLGDYSTYSAEIVDTTIRGWDAAPGIQAGNALRLSAGVKARISGSMLLGGNSVQPSGAEMAGADALRTGYVVGDVDAFLDGNSGVYGGASAFGPGGAGIALPNSAIVGIATVQGGGGVVPGVDYLGAAPTFLPHTLRLSVQPALAHAAAPTYLHGGETLQLSLDPIGLPGGFVLGWSLNQPAGSGVHFSPLLSTIALIVPSPNYSLTLPQSPSLATTGIYLHAQGWFLDLEGGGGILVTNARAVRGDL